MHCDLILTADSISLWQFLILNNQLSLLGPETYKQDHGSKSPLNKNAFNISLRYKIILPSPNVNYYYTASTYDIIIIKQKFLSHLGGYKWRFSSVSKDCSGRRENLALPDAGVLINRTSHSTCTSMKRTWNGKWYKFLFFG